MFSGKIGLMMIILCAALCTETALAQQSTPAPPDAQRPASGFRNRVIELKHRDPESLLSVIKLLGSGAGGASMSVNNEFNTITVRDYPENIATIEEAVRRLDTPAPPAPGVEFHVHILIATNTQSPSNPVPAELNDVIKQLQTTLSYKNYYVMTSAVLRTKEGPTGISNKGVADFRLANGGAASERPIFYEYAARQIKLDGTAATASGIQVGNFGFNMNIPVETTPGTINYDRVGFETPVNMREGEKVVVGTTTMQDKGVIVVLTARIVK